ncbi:hypothetical protein C8R45DRAFT_1131710 [Mycena sanguinolenta]|nr:hypothetical protein C8R45DRAFT_1131710 [Mycena sanguinolenta]
MTPRGDIHSLPTETLSDIFRIAVAAVTPSFWELGAPAVLRTELERIAGAPLLILSRVCSRWHSETAIHHPTFWSNIEVNGVTGNTPSLFETTITLLNARLRRSRDAPLSVSIFREDDQPFHPDVFLLLVRHSHRWEEAHFFGSLQGLDTSALSGNLPRLKTFGVNLRFETVEFFQIAPHLENLYLNAPLVHSEFCAKILHRKQLRSLRCGVMLPANFQGAISLLPKLPATTDFYLIINLDTRVILQHHTFLQCMLIPSTTSLISTLTCELVQDFHPHHMSSVLNQVFESLTLPQLRKLLLCCAAYPRRVLEWPHAQFIELCERSNLGRSLKSLRIAEVRIAEKDLLETLSVLPALEHLEVGDAPEKVSSGEGEGKHDGLDSVLIADSFLQALTCRSLEDCLAPHLSYFACVSHLAFTPSHLVDFATSRLALLSDSLISFHDVRCISRWITLDRDFDFDTVTTATLRPNYPQKIATSGIQMGDEQAGSTDWLSPARAT